jgi:Fe-S-cluster containining protein
MKLANIKNICKKCKAKCCKLGGAEFTKKEMTRVLAAGFKDYFRKINNNHYETKTKNGVCAYLDKNNLCTIQNLKPKMCFAWPVNLGFKKNKKIYYLMSCPLTPYLSSKEIKIMKKQISGYTQDLIDCNDTQMSDKEVEKVMKRYYKFKKEVKK